MVSTKVNVLFLAVNSLRYQSKVHAIMQAVYTMIVNNFQVINTLSCADLLASQCNAAWSLTCWRCTFTRCRCLSGTATATVINQAV